MYVWFFFFQVCIYFCVCLVPLETRRGCRTSWNWFWIVASCPVDTGNLSPLQEQVFLTIGPSLAISLDFWNSYNTVISLFHSSLSFFLFTGFCLYESYFILLCLGAFVVGHFKTGSHCRPSKPGTHYICFWRAEVNTGHHCAQLSFSDFLIG